MWAWVPAGSSAAKERPAGRGESRGVCLGVVSEAWEREEVRGSACATSGLRETVGL